MSQLVQLYANRNAILFGAVTPDCQHSLFQLEFFLDSDDCHNVAAELHPGPDMIGRLSSRGRILICHQHNHPPLLITDGVLRKA